ncbi:MAG: type II toxin-antitoxin system HipA family toxin [Actinomycetota bacterium]
MWGTTIGAAILADGESIAAFEYDPAFVGSGIELAPLVMPLARGRVYRFPELAEGTFHGLPGLLADSLPDRFGEAVIAAWLAGQGRDPAGFDALERLSYVGSRGMGALEFAPALGPRSRAADRVHVNALVALASEILTSRRVLSESFDGMSREGALAEILRVGTSAGGARAKAVIAWNPDTQEVRTGQADAPEGFEHWLLKFDGVRGNRDRESLSDPDGFCAVEYAYSLMARDAGIEMPDTRLLEEGGRRHFMARRFDRPRGGDRLHMQSLGALAHLDYNQALANSYEQAFAAIRALDLGPAAMEEQFRRMVFNIVARNQDDHVKNIAFLMDRRGTWRLSPAFDVTYAFNPSGAWTRRHQMSLTGKNDGFTRGDLRDAGRTASLKQGRADAILNEVTGVVRRWPEYAERVGVRDALTREVTAGHRLRLPRS